MFILLGVLLISLGTLLIWLHIPYSPLKAQFLQDVASLQEHSISVDSDVFTEKDFEDLPIAIQRYVKNCGYIGTPKMNYMTINFHNVQFKQGKNGSSLTIDYTQYNFLESVSRLAFIESSLFSIPFEGYDYYNNGIGSMQGVIGKTITLFHQTGAEMDKAALVTFLAECLFMPSVILQDSVHFNEINDFEVEATISYHNQTVSGIFHFNEDYEMTSFITKDRAVSENDGTMKYIPWSAICGDYVYTNLGIKFPTKFKAVWHYEDGDLNYFDGKISEIRYNY